MGFGGGFGRNCYFKRDFFGCFLLVTLYLVRQKAVMGRCCFGQSETWAVNAYLLSMFTMAGL